MGAFFRRMSRKILNDAEPILFIFPEWFGLAAHAGNAMRAAECPQPSLVISSGAYRAGVL
jgi:hypothetical protein